MAVNIPKKVLITFFTVSQNTAYVVSEIEKEFKEHKWETKLVELCDINIEHIRENPDMFVFGCPVHFWDMPDAAVSALRKIPAFENKPSAFIFSTFGKCVINPVTYQIAEELSPKGVNIIGGAQIVTPHSTRINGGERLGNLEKNFGKNSLSEESLKKVRNEVSAIINKFENGAKAIDIKEFKKLSTRGPIATLMNTVMSTRAIKIMVPHPNFKLDECKKCGKCIKKCPSNALSFNSEKKINLDKKKCKKCSKCIEVCPNNAVAANWKQLELLVRIAHILSAKTETRFKY